MSLKYKGRTFSSGQSLANAMQRDLKAAMERAVRSAATSSGARTTRVSNGDLIVHGDLAALARFNRKISR
jgi:hypothetical protein